MAREPFTGLPDVQQQGPVDAFEHTQATPQEFGAGVGQAEQGLARAGEQASDLIAQNAQRLQELTNDRNANQAINGYMTAAGQEWAKYGSMGGQAAHDYYPTFQKNLSDLRDQYGSSLQSPMAKQAYDDNSRFMTSRLNMQGATHAAEGLKQSFKITNANNFDSAINQGILGQNDLPSVAMGAARASDALRQNAKLDGMTDEQAEFEAQKGRGAYYQRVLKDMVDKGNVGQAAQIFNTVRPNLDGGSILAIDGMMRPIIRNQAMDGWINGAMGTSPSGFIDSGTQQRAQQVHDGLVKRGMDSDTAWGFSANAVAESGANPASIEKDANGNPTGPGRGMFQWTDKQRKDAYIARNGHSPEQGSVDEQLDHVMWEIGPGGPEHGSYQQIQATQGGPGVKAAAVSTLYERPKNTDMEEINRAGIASRLSGDTINPNGQKSPAEQAFPDEEAITQKAIRDFPDPYELNQVVGKVRARISLLNASVAQDRAALSSTIPQMEAQALDGHDIDLNDAFVGHIHHVFPPEKAAELTESLGIAKAVAPQFAAVKYGTPDDVAKQEAQLTANLGLGNANPETSELPDLAGSNEQYRMRQTILKKFQSALSAREAALNGAKADPASYAAGSPIMQQAGAKVTAPMPPGLNQDQQQAVTTQRTQDFIRDSVSFQHGLGVKAPHVLTRARAEQEATAINSAGPDADVGQMLAKTARDSGTGWNQRFADLKWGGLNPEYQTLAQIDSPTARSDFQSMLKYVAAAPKNRDSLYDTVGRPNVTQIERDIPTTPALSDFAKTANIPGIRNNVDQIAQVEEGVKDLAAFYLLPGGGSTMSDSYWSGKPSALNRAANAIVGDKYAFDTTDNYLRVPRAEATLKQVQDYGDTLKGGLKADDLQGVPSGVTPRSLGIEQSQDQGVNERVQRDIVAPIQAAGSNILGAIQRTGKWVTNESDSGAYLVAQDENGRNRPVRKTDGSRVEFSWKDARGGPPATPAVALRGDVPPVQQ